MCGYKRIYYISIVNEQRITIIIGNYRCLISCHLFDWVSIEEILY